MSLKTKVGVIGQGFVGKTYADFLEKKEGVEVIRYSLDDQFIHNKEDIKDCEIVLVAVPTPTHRAFGQDLSALNGAMGIIGPGAIVIIKSTVLPGTTRTLSEVHPDKVVLFSPEFLSEKTAKTDVEHPFLVIIGTPYSDDLSLEAALKFNSLLGYADAKPKVCTSDEAELFKYIHNVSGYINIVMYNMFSEVVDCPGFKGNWDSVKELIKSDRWLAREYSDVNHNGHGAGGRCFIKDFAAFRRYADTCGYGQGLDLNSRNLLHSIQMKNHALLKASHKDIEILNEVVGR